MINKADKMASVVPITKPSSTSAGRNEVET